MESLSRRETHQAFSWWLCLVIRYLQVPHVLYQPAELLLFIILMSPFSVGQHLEITTTVWKEPSLGSQTCSLPPQVGLHMVSHSDH